jgi:hypothetical protein
MHAATVYTSSIHCERPSLRITSSTLAFAAALLFVGVVSLYDGYLVLRTGEMIEQFEKNPVGLFLIQFNGGDPSLFLALKALGTMLALALLTVLYHRAPRYAYPAASGLALFQSGLLIFLERA